MYNFVLNTKLSDKLIVTFKVVPLIMAVHSALSNYQRISLSRTFLNPSSEGLKSFISTFFPFLS